MPLLDPIPSPVANADFAALAREYSDDQTAKTNGGNLGWFAARQMDRDFSAGAFALTKPGQVSEPVLSAFGYHIILLEARKPAELQPFDTVKDRILAEARREYVNTAKKVASERIFNDPTLQWNQPALDALSATLDADVAKKAGGTPFKRPENGQFKPGTGFKKFFFDETGDTNAQRAQPGLPGHREPRDELVPCRCRAAQFGHDRHARLARGARALRRVESAHRNHHAVLQQRRDLLVPAVLREQRPEGR